MASEPGLSDYLPIPHNTAPLTDPDKQEVAQSLTDAPTMSHALAMDDHEEKGEAQLAHDGEVKDLGWTDHVDDIPNPLVGGMPNQDLWVLIRRFNKVSPSEALQKVDAYDTVANVSRQRVPLSSTWRFGSEHCRRRRVLA